MTVNYFSLTRFHTRFHIILIICVRTIIILVPQYIIILYYYSLVRANFRKLFSATGSIKIKGPECARSPLAENERADQYGVRRGVGGGPDGGGGGPTRG